VVTFCFVDPSSLFGVAGEGFGVDVLDGEDRQRGGFGAVGGVRPTSVAHA